MTDNDRVSFLVIRERWNENIPHYVTVPIPQLPEFNAGSYKNVKIEQGALFSDKLVNVNDYGIASVAFYRNEALYNPTYEMNIPGAPEHVYLRESVCKQLQKVNAFLNPFALELLCYDGHRSIATQRKLWNAFIKKAEAKGLSGKAAEDFAITYCSNPEGFKREDPSTWPIHSTGGAVDIYMRDKISGKVVDLGEGYFDNPAEVTHTRYYENLAEKRELNCDEQAALEARRLLYHCMVELGGFVNFPFETFHYDFHDQFWGRVKGLHAGYGYEDSPETAKVLLNELAASRSQRR